MSNSVQPFFLTDQFSWNSFCPAGKHKAHGLYFILQLHTLLGERSRVERNREQERGARKRCKDARKRCNEVERGRDARKMFMEETKTKCGCKWCIFSSIRVIYYITKSEL